MKLALLALRVASSFKTEIKVILIALSVLILMPTFAVIVVAGSGLQAISDALAWLNPTTHKVEVRDPNGVLKLELDATTAWPTKGYISAEFGVPHLPWQVTHTGIDIANPQGKIGDPVTTFMVGKVTKTGPITEGCGQCVYIDHGNNITSRYLHLSRINVQPEQEVNPGDIIGLMGDEGWSTGPHLHFEIRVYGVPVNPRIFMVGEPVL